MEITLKPRTVAGVMAGVTTLLVLAQIGVLICIFGLDRNHVCGLVPLFNCLGEANFPTFYSSTALLFCAALLAVIAVAERKVGRRPWRWWMLLAGVFVFLSVDEAVTLHERLTIKTRHFLQVSGPLYYAWIVPYGIAGGVLLLLSWRSIARLPRVTRQLCIIAGIIYVGGALGMEMVEGYYYTSHGETIDFVYVMLGTIEELLEMAGVLLFVYALMHHLEHAHGSVCVRIGAKSG